MLRRWDVVFFLLIFHQLRAADLAAVSPSGPEKRLMANLFQNYDPTVRPRRNSSETVDVSITYHMTSIQEVDEKTQTVSTVGWTTITWIDDYLSWNPTDYDNVTMIVLPVEKIWTPDLVFENSVGSRFYDTSFFRPRIYSDGSISWEPGGPMELSCGLVLTDYPFDVQKCHIKLVTWANTGSKVFAYAESLDLDSYEANGGWKLINIEAINSSFTLDGETYAEVYFYFTLRRLPLFHIMNILVPVFLLSVLNLLVFCLPPQSGEKVTLSLTVLLAFSVFLLMMNGIMPSTSINVPVMGIYITIFMCISSVSVLITVLVIRMHEQVDNYRLPKWAIELYALAQRVCRTKKQNVVGNLEAGKEPGKYKESVAGSEQPGENTESDEQKELAEHTEQRKVGEHKRHQPVRAKVGKDEVSWRSVANVLDLLSFYAFALIILILTGVVVGNLLSSSAKTVSSIEL